MNLFSTDHQLNLLPADGTVLYYGSILPVEEADRYFARLLQEIEWKHDEAFLFGKHLITNRKVAWYADTAYAYTYSNITRKALPWTDALRELKQLTESITGAMYNSCLLNLYPSGADGMGWHSDDEKTLAREQPIASLSFGAERRFAFKHKQTGDTISLLLEKASLLVMKDATQTNWLHRLPPTKKVTTPRINLTFRTMRPRTSSE